jgi:hypothetical protein
VRKTGSVDNDRKHGRALGRLVAHENSASDLLAYLIELDSAPLARVLDLPEGAYQAEREVPGKGRLDLVVRRETDGHPVAVLELKGASTVHGDQLERYRTWAESFEPAPELFYCTLDDDAPPTPWQSLDLVDLFAAWENTGHPHAAWLADEIADVLRTWDREADGLIGAATGWYVPDLVSRRTAKALDTRLRAAHPDGSEARAYRTSGGNPMFMAWRRHPRGSGNAWIAVDVRCEGRSDATRSWLFRPCIDVFASGRDAQLEAHDLAVALGPAMTLPAIRAATEGLEPANALSAPRHDGLRGPLNPSVLATWRAGIGSTSRRHPVFYHDRGLRLATQLQLDVTTITRFDLAELTLSVLDHLATQAAATPVPSEEAAR